jgi:hypothetical protein
VKKGTYNFTIYANNSNGVASGNVVFTLGSSLPPIEVTECGILFSSDTEYVLMNNVSEVVCFEIYAKNITFDLNGKRVGGSPPIYGECVGSKIFNGTLSSDYWGLVMFDSNKCIIRDMNIFGWGLASLLDSNSMLFERIYANVTDSGFACESRCDMTVRNSTLELSGESIEYPSGILIQEAGTSFTRFVLENTVIVNFPYHVDLSNFHSDYYIRNTNLDLSKISGHDSGFTRFYVQHLLKVNVTENGTGVPAKVDILDNSSLPKLDPQEIEFVVDSNPTSNMSIATNDEGLVEAWLTEKLILYTSFSPTIIEEYSYSPYVLIAKGKDTNQTQILDIVGNSTFRINFNLTFPKLPPCTLDEMFDLNNDSIININDAIIMLRRITGLSVETGATKKCEARNFFPTS